MEELKKFQWLVAQFLCYYNDSKIPENIKLFKDFIHHSTKLVKDINSVIQHIDDDYEEDEYAIISNERFFVCSVQYNSETISELTHERVSSFEDFANSFNKFIYDIFKLYTDDILDEILPDLFRFFTTDDLDKLEDGNMFANLESLGYNIYLLSATDKRYYKYLTNHIADDSNKPNICIRDISAYYYMYVRDEAKQMVYFILPK